jgi:predicted PurR-regulated permease PerM
MFNFNLSNKEKIIILPGFIIIFVILITSSLRSYYETIFSSLSIILLIFIIINLPYELLHKIKTIFKRMNCVRFWLILIISVAIICSFLYMASTPSSHDIRVPDSSLPKLPSLPSLPSLPKLPSLPSLPSLPKLPN